MFVLEYSDAKDIPAYYLESLTWVCLHCLPLPCAASGKEEESPAQGYGGRSGVPLSDNENRRAETRPCKSQGRQPPPPPLFNPLALREAA